MRLKQVQKGQVLYACPEEDVVILRVSGKGDSEISPQIKMISDKFNRTDYSPRYILDLEHCLAMDSTFMGMIAAVALHQIACRDRRLVVVNAEATPQHQLEKLGLKYILEIHEGKLDLSDMETLEFQESPEIHQSRFERIIHMIQSHKALIDADSGNEIKFKEVLQTLSESLGREPLKRDQKENNGQTEKENDEKQ